ncbi:hypothetical protein GGR52DRAFT_569599 [Hypoxylon sp. FL1284]|nr:hypothetical protein GGR52DRAFT_569599 [Hypoxylon sp. FL1284]
MASQSSDEQPEPPRLQRTLAVARKILVHYHTINTYFPIDDLPSMDILYGELNFETGESTDGQGHFFELPSLDSMHDTLRAKNPGPVCHPSVVNIDQDDWYKSNAMWHNLALWLTLSEDDWVAGLIDDAGWWRMCGYKALFRHVDDMHWTLDALYDHDIFHHDDVSQPHELGVLSDNQPLRDDSISLGELVTITYLNIRQLNSRSCKKHRVAPITLVSGSGLSVRTVQGFIDPDAEKLIIRKTPVMNYTARSLVSSSGFKCLTVVPEDNWDLHVNLLRWLTAAPVGETR